MPGTQNLADKTQMNRDLEKNTAVLTNEGEFFRQKPIRQLNQSFSSLFNLQKIYFKAHVIDTLTLFIYSLFFHSPCC